LPSGATATCCTRRCPPGISHSETLLPLISGDAARSRSWALAICTGWLSPLVRARLPACVLPAVSRRVWRSPTPAGHPGRYARCDGAGQRRRAVIVLLDARMGEIYHGRFSAGMALAAVAVCSPMTLPVPDSAGWLACGNGLPPIRSAAATGGLRTALAARADARRRRGRASCCAASGARRLGRCGGGAPLYVRNKVALTVSERLAGGKA
jgi:tRNA threonylcarbamoyladenosine biosynthesis protein TsaB